MNESDGERKPVAPVRSKAARLVSSKDLLGEERVLRIEHNGEIYLLRLTRNGRLILTK